MTASIERLYRSKLERFRQKVDLFYDVCTKVVDGQPQLVGHITITKDRAVLCLRANRPDRLPASFSCNP